MIRNSLPAPMMRTRPPVQRDHGDKLSAAKKQEESLPRLRTEEALSVELEALEETPASKEFLNQPLSRTPTPHLSEDEEEEIYTEGMRALLLALESTIEDAGPPPSRIVSPVQTPSPQSSVGVRQQSIRKPPRSTVRRKNRSRRHVRNNSRSSIGSLPRIPEFDENDETKDFSFTVDDYEDTLTPSPLVRHGGDGWQSPTADSARPEDDGSESLNARVLFKPPVQDDSLPSPEILSQNTPSRIRSSGAYSTYTGTSEYIEEDSFSTAFTFLTGASMNTAPASQAFQQIDLDEECDDDVLPRCHPLTWFMGAWREGF